MDFVYYIRVVRRKLLWIVSFVLIACLTSFYVTYKVLPPSYESSVRLIVNSGDKLDLGAVNTNILLINTFKELIKSPTVLNKTVSEYPDLKLSAEDLSKKLKVSSSKDSQLLTISITKSSYEYGNQIVNAVAKVFQSQVANIMQVHNIYILPDGPADGEAPKATSKLLINVLLAFVVSLLLSVGFIIARETLDDTIKNPAVLEAELGLIPLGNVSVTTKKDWKRREAKTMNRKVGDPTYAKLS
ncbi:YveK family protein [Paenibacillus oleatilyticus]|uniref:YveK family protein n=1 Tax=Paenibacillus oleatilyticus TaxID=2594886 RepID=A0ABV4V760_9BACL|nr:Wzz/FepE/Etk N-terminal domain-containing protein [Paenibacillus oleatilyticus]MBU7320067.1 hypothetical protein [Paenibacillus oleatilyticus]